jgi:alpha-amylase/alpha-mannosidase (GH57 family)
MRKLPATVFSDSDFTFSTPAETPQNQQPDSAIHVPHAISWADEERDLTAWLGNDLQDEAFDKLYMLEESVKKCADPQIQKDWLYLQTSDHFYYMCTKWFSDGAVHKYFNPYGTPYDAFINYMNVLSDFIMRVENCGGTVNDDFKTFKKEVSELSEKVEKVVRKTAKATSKKVKETVAKTKEIKFEDIKEMSDTTVKKLLKEIDAEELTVALKGAGKELTEKVIPNLGKRAKKEYDKLEGEIKKVKKSDIKKMRNNIEQKLKDLFG